MPLQSTSGAASYDAFGGGVAAVPNYIEEVFSTHLYTGNGSTQTITNGIDLAGEGGLVWSKERTGTNRHRLYDTVRGGNKSLTSEDADAQDTWTAPYIMTFNSNGYATGLLNNESSFNYVSWTFRKQPKFFDVVTYTGNDTSRSISHSLGSVPGCIIIKNVSSSGFNWVVYHRSNSATDFLNLNTTAAVATNATYFSSAPTSTVFNIGAGGLVNNGSDTYVAYLFAHDAGGFGLEGTDNVISCGSFTVDGSGNSSINLGYEPQWLLMKQTNTTGSWIMQDTMRGQTADNGYSRLLADTSGAETSTTTGFIRINATGFSTNGATGLTGDHIYIAIRRGPMKVPTSGTEVFAPLARNTNGTNTQITTTLSTVDMVMYGDRNGIFGQNSTVIDRLRGYTKLLRTSGTSSESTNSSAMTGFDVQKGYGLGTDTSGFGTNYSVGGPYPVVNWQFGRAPGFFDEVCYTGTGANRTVAHNLAAVPELMIVKDRTTSWNWIVSGSLIGAANYLVLNGSNTQATNAQFFNNTNPTSSVFSLGTQITTNGSGDNYVAYLFATLAGVSKVGSYTGTGTTLQIDCGFTGGARFVMIKRTDSTGDWYVWDSARGIIAGNDPYLLLNSTAAEVTSTDYIDPYSLGFEISSTAPAAINASGGSFIFLAIA